MKTLRFASLSTLTGALLLIGTSTLAQSSLPIPPPPTASDPAPSPRSVRSNDAGVVESTNSAGQPASSGSIQDLRFAAVDANADGRISLGEFVTFMEAGNVTRNADIDRGSISPAELLFRRIDRNNDNFLSEAEITAYQDEQAREGMKR